MSKYAANLKVLLLNTFMSQKKKDKMCMLFQILKHVLPNVFLENNAKIQTKKEYIK